MATISQCPPSDEPISVTGRTWTDDVPAWTRQTLADGVDLNDQAAVLMQRDNFLYDGVLAAQKKASEWKSPNDAGAKGDGLTDDSDALVASGSFLFLPAGFNYRVSKDISIGRILAAGGTITVDAGKTLTVASVMADESSVIFRGSGTVKIDNQVWSLGWFSGNSANVKWDNLRKGLTWNVPYRLTIPAPLANDPAAVQSSSGEWWWKLTAPMFFDDPENEGIVYVHGSFRCMNSMPSGFTFSPINKTENIMFFGLLRVDGQSLCDYPIWVRGGARIKFIGELRPSGGVDNFRADASLWPIDELELDILHSTGFSRHAAYFGGSDGSRPFTNSKFNHLMTNGARPGSTPQDFFKYEGVLRSIQTGVVTCHVDGTLVGPSNAVVKVVPNAVSAPAFGIQFGTIANRVNDYTVLDLGPGGTNRSNVTVGDLYGTGTQARPTVNLTWAQSVKINKIEPVGAWINITSDCIDVELPTVDLWRLKDSGVRTRVNGVLTRSITAGTGPFANDSVTQFNLRDSNTRRTGLVSIATSADHIYGVLHVRVGSQNLLRAVAAGLNLNVMPNGVLTGQTGPTGKVNVAVSGDVLYIENRTGGGIDLHATCT